MVEQGAHSPAKAGVVEGTTTVAEEQLGVEEEGSFLHSWQCQDGWYQGVHLVHPAG